MIIMSWSAFPLLSTLNMNQLLQSSPHFCQQALLLHPWCWCAFHSEPICHGAGAHLYLMRNLLVKASLWALTSHLQDIHDDVKKCGESKPAKVLAPHLHFTESIIGHLVHEAVEQSGWASFVHSELSLRGEVVALLKTREAGSAQVEMSPNRLTKLLRFLLSNTFNMIFFYIYSNDVFSEACLLMQSKDSMILWNGKWFWLIYTTVTFVSQKPSVKEQKHEKYY